MATNTKRSWGWTILFTVLAISNIARLILGVGHVVGCTLQAIGFLVMALSALFSPRGSLALSWRQFYAPRKLASVAAVALLVIGTAMQWFKI